MKTDAECFSELTSNRFCAYIELSSESFLNLYNQTGLLFALQKPRTELAIQGIKRWLDLVFITFPGHVSLTKGAA